MLVSLRRRVSIKMVTLMVMGCSVLSQSALAQLTTPGSFSVGPNGAATYSIPILLPVGVAGLAPNLALVYNSQGGDGPLGLGWGISGLSSIARCPRTVNHDGARGSVNYDLNDRYCLDGQRLIAVNGADGGAGTQYRADSDGFSYIASFSEAGAVNGPGSFVVKTKSGLTLEYGKTLDSRVELNGSGVVMAWALNKATDANGNSYMVSYSEDVVNRQYFPDSITYGDSGSPVVVKFLLQKTERVDYASGYVKGQLIRNTRLLDSIEVRKSGFDVKRYELIYGRNLISGKNSLNSIRFSAGGVYESDLLFEKQNEKSAAKIDFFRYETKQGDYLASGANWFQSDVNGDGLVDFLHVFNDDGNITTDVHVNTGSGFLLRRWETRSGNYLASNAQFFVSDANGDGLPDLIYVFSDGGFISTDVHVNTGSGFSLQRWETKSGTYLTSNAQFFVSDANGDGLPDLIYVFSDGGGISTDVHVNTGSGFSLQRWETRSGNFLASNAQFFVSDANGDGLPDLIYVFSDGGFISTDVHVNTGSGFSLQRWGTKSGTYLTSNAQFFVSDANGDGLPDLIYVFSDGGFISTDVHVNTGSGFSLQRWETKSGTYLTSNAQFFVSDANGDGLPDLIYVFSDGGFISTDVHVNTGSGFSSQRWETKSGNYLTSNAQFFVSDANGDGLPDLIYVFSDGGFISTDVHVNKGSSFSLQRWETKSGNYLTSNAQFHLADVNSDGVADLVYVFSDAGKISADVHFMPTQNSGVTMFSRSGGPKVGVIYSYGSQVDVGFYAPGRVSSYPNIYIPPSGLFVKEVVVDDGVGGVRRTNYSYGNLRAQIGLKGRGNLGFQWMQTKDVSTGLINRTCFRQDHPYIGMVSQSIQGTSDANWPACGSFKGGATGVATPNVLSLTTNTYAAKVYSGASTAATDCGDSCTISAGQRYFVYPSQTVTQSWDWDSGTTFIALPQSRTSTTYDNWGNAVTIKAETLNPDGTVTGYAKTTTNKYAPANTSNWILGRVTKTTVESAAP